MIRTTLLALLVALLAGCERKSSEAPADEISSVWFSEEAKGRGLDFHHKSGSDGRYLLPEIMGGGAALVDLDNDGDLDAYLIQSDASDHNRLYENDGLGRFRERSDSGAEDAGYGIGVTTGDYNGDGLTDLYVTNAGANVLLRNEGNLRFKDVSDQAGVADSGFSTATAFLDADDDGDLDLFVVNYVDWHPGVERDCYDYGTGVRNYCDPGNYDLPSADRLYRNEGDGTFTDATDTAGINRSRGNGLGIVTADFNGDGRTDVFVANDKTMNHLWINEGGLRFSEQAMRWGCAMDDHGIAKAGMGVATADADDDGDPDLLVVNIEGETDSFYRNDGGFFTDATAARGLGTLSRRYTRFGVALTDFDNDGLLDLYEANGRVTYSPEPEDEDVYAEPNVLFRGTETGRFIPHPLGEPQRIHTSRGVSIGDIDGDGGVDLLVVNRDARPYLLLNRVPERGNWVRVRPEADGQVDLAARITAQVGKARKTREVQVAGSYLAAHESWVHFGLGGETSIRDVTVHWADGTHESFGEITGGSRKRLQRGSGVTVADD